MGGNIGKPILELDPIRQGLCYVIECSSYQIDLSPSLKPTVGVLLNLTPDHIDRHGSFEHYAQVKQRLVAGAKTAIDPQRIEKSFALDSLSLDGISSLRGRHNAQNALAALAAVEALGIDRQQAYAALFSFKGLPHRMEEVGKKGHVLFINDSKATNAEACAPALSSFDVIYWIAGGLAKQGGIESLKPFFSKIRHAYLIGSAAEDFQSTIGKATAVTLSGTLAQAVVHAMQAALADKTGGQVANEKR